MTRPLLVGALTAAALSGCAERELVTAPRSTPTTGTWVLVWTAGALAAVVIGALLTLPAWRQPGGARLAVALLTLQSGAVVVAGSVLAGGAVRCWQLVDRPDDAPPAVALLRLSHVEGDTGFFALMVLVVVVVSALVTTMLALAARLASSTDTLERSVACVVLGLELGVALVGTTLLLLGAHGWPYLGAALALPLIAAAFATCWPTQARRDPAPAPSRSSSPSVTLTT